MFINDSRRDTVRCGSYSSSLLLLPILFSGRGNTEYQITPFVLYICPLTVCPTTHEITPSPCVIVSVLSVGLPLLGFEVGLLTHLPTPLTYQVGDSDTGFHPSIGVPSRKSGGLGPTESLIGHGRLTSTETGGPSDGWCREKFEGGGRIPIL